MKLKFFSIFFALALVLTGCSNNLNLKNQETSNDITSSTEIMTDNQSIESSNDELYQDIFLTSLNPYIEKAITQYYGYPLNNSPLYDEIISVKRLQGYRSLDFELAIKVKPFRGAHVIVGEDIITIRSNTGGVEVLNFEHVKDYPLTPNL